MMKRSNKSGAAGKRRSDTARGPVRALSSRQSKYFLRLYVSGSTARSVQAIKNIKHLCEQHLTNQYNLEVIDIYQQPSLARSEQIVAVPTLIIRMPLPLRRLIGDLSNLRQALFGLNLLARET